MSCKGGMMFFSDSTEEGEVEGPIHGEVQRA